MSALLPVEAAYERYQRNEITYDEYRAIAEREEVARSIMRKNGGRHDR